MKPLNNKTKFDEALCTGCETKHAANQAAFSPMPASSRENDFDSLARDILGTYRRAAWGCYAVADIIDDRTALCFDYEGPFEKRITETVGDRQISRTDFREAEDKRRSLRFSESLRLWGEDLAKLLRAPESKLLA